MSVFGAEIVQCTISGSARPDQWLARTEVGKATETWDFWI